jgi:addiction module RelE/StbE family toxin
VAYRLIWSTRAETELRKIAEYIKRDSAANAATVISKLTGEVRRLKQFPFSGRIVPEWNNATFRELIVYDYRVVYKLGPDTASILTILHSRRRFPKRPPRFR